MFACLYYIISYSHGDLEHDINDPAWVPCIQKIDGFAACFLFSLETQHTIGRREGGLAGGQILELCCHCQVTATGRLQPTAQRP